MDIKISNTPQINFKAMKSSQFKSLEYSAMRKFKAPIEKFNVMEDFYSWAAKRCREVINKDLGGRNSFVQLKRQVLKQEWISHVMNLKTLNPPAALLVLCSLFKGLKDNNSDLLPILDEEVFSRTLADTKLKVEENKDIQFDFKKKYLMNLRQKQTNITDGWICIPSKKNDSANYKENLEKLRILSPRTWCTKNEKAEEYLEENDIHIYFVNGSPELGMRVNDSKAYDIAGFVNNGKIPLQYLDIIKDYIIDNGYSMGLETEFQVRAAELLRNRISEMRKDIGEAIDNNDVFSIMEYFGFSPKLLEDGTISIAGYMQPRYNTFFELGIDENKLFEKISEIRGNAAFRNCSACSLKNIRRIGGMANFNESSLIDTGALEQIGGDLYLANSKLVRLPNLRQVGGTINFQNSMLSEHDLKGLFV